MEEVQGYLSEIGLSVSVSPEKGRCLFTARNFSPACAFCRRDCHKPTTLCFCAKRLRQEPQDVKSVFLLINSRSALLVILCGIVGVLARHSKLEKERLKYLTPSIRLMVKLYLRRKPQDEKVIPTTVTDNYNLVEALVSHMSEIDEKQLVLYAQMANLVSVILQWPGLRLMKHIDQKYKHGWFKAAH